MKILEYESDWFKESKKSGEIVIHLEILYGLITENEELKKENKAKDDFI